MVHSIPVRKEEMVAILGLILLKRATKMVNLVGALLRSMTFKPRNTTVDAITGLTEAVPRFRGLVGLKAPGKGPFKQGKHRGKRSIMSQTMPTVITQCIIPSENLFIYLLI